MKTDVRKARCCTLSLHICSLAERRERTAHAEENFFPGDSSRDNNLRPRGIDFEINGSRSAERRGRQEKLALQMCGPRIETKIQPRLSLPRQPLPLALS